MKIFEESGFEFDFSNSITSYKADEPSYDGLNGVDFIVETPDEYLFIEVKNLDNKRARPENRTEFLEEMRGNEFFLKMAAKFKDSLLKELAMSHTFHKPVSCIFLLEYTEFDARQRSRLYERIDGRIPKFEEKVYNSVESIRFKLHTKEEFINAYTFNVTEELGTDDK